ncbi:unnamed protein product [Acanthosepion pharaonis]|uniref:Uncharacterized protein n=1 Tax=Acanthosepion pharaonis TaxID=158019 RepID=A0A812EEM7_ACAPH|nr:unnamed protein product [Sepia pharaonis]
MTLPLPLTLSIAEVEEDPSPLGVFSYCLSFSFCRLGTWPAIKQKMCSLSLSCCIAAFLLEVVCSFFLSVPFCPLFKGLVTVETAFFLLLLGVTSFEIFSSALSFSHKYFLLRSFLTFFFSFSINCLLSLFHPDVTAIHIRHQTGPSIPLGDEFSSQPREHIFSAHMPRQVLHMDKFCEHVF